MISAILRFFNEHIYCFNTYLGLHHVFLLEDCVMSQKNVFVGGYLSTGVNRICVCVVLFPAHQLL